MINSPRVCIQVQSVYIEAQSSPDNERYVFAYTVTIRNLGRAPVQLLGRYWLITNGNGRETEVQGEGVVGVQPLIAPGEEYQYTSGAIIETPLGTMQGHYEMIDENGVPFSIDIPVFLSRITTEAFNQRRKTIRNSLGNLFSVEVLTGMGIDPAMRAENISVAQYCQMANYLAENAPLQES